MDALRYTRAIDLEDTNNAHALAVLSVPPGSSVLDIGCAAGHVGSALHERGCRVWGVEIDPAAAAVASASEAYERVVMADAETLDFTREFKDLEFGAIMLLDVLEHLKEPEKVLLSVRPLLTDGGRLIVSIPNVTHAALRLELLSGRFRYREIGLLDRTHLRFFDRQGVEDLLRAGGFVPEDFLRVTRELEETEFDLPLDTLPPEVIAAATAGTDAKTYQFVVIAAPKDTPSSVGHADSAHTVSLAERLQAEREGLKQQITESSRYLEHLEADFAEQMERLQSEHREEMERLQSEHREELQQLELERGLFENDLMVKEAYIAELRARIAELEAESESQRGRITELELESQHVPDALKYRVADVTANAIIRIPFVYRGGRWFLTKVFRGRPNG